MYITRIIYRSSLENLREGKELKILIQKGLITRTYHEHRAWCRRWEARRGLYCWLYTWKLYWARRVWFASAANYSRSLFRSRLSSSSWTLKQGRSNVCSDMRFYIEFLQGTTRVDCLGMISSMNLSMKMSVEFEREDSWSFVFRTLHVSKFSTLYITL